ncbi:uncharacterized protein LOC144911091 [Branchiostoma floridae x Branchiostoma belcheri]
MSGNSHNIEKVPELPPPNLLAGESDVHFTVTAVQQHREFGSTTHPCSFHFAKAVEEEIATRDPQEFSPPETVSSEQMSTCTKDEESCRHRRERNRDAAARWRFRRRAREERLRKHTICLENANSGLRTEIARLQHELRSLSKHVMNHMELCHAGPSYTGQLTTGPTGTHHVQDSSTLPQDSINSVNQFIQSIKQTKTYKSKKCWCTPELCIPFLHWLKKQVHRNTLYTNMHKQ